MVTKCVILYFTRFLAKITDPPFYVVDFSDESTSPCESDMNFDIVGFTLSGSVCSIAN